MANVRGATFQEVLSAFRNGRNRLEHLTENDWALMLDKAERRSFPAGEDVFTFGKQDFNIFIIVNGTAHVLSSRGWQIASVGPGEILGEMAFLENGRASAGVKAYTKLETFALSWTTLHLLFESYPHLGSRFYRSIAVSLSRRLRQQISD
ncbi:MAG: cyclic nucleotide-binding domain-containing protein [Acidobacteriaceae bacterium]|nr:cyclic nucleotide-binding domain-containing protein [Acidobacteriaceae bacterium]